MRNVRRSSSRLLCPLIVAVLGQELSCIQLDCHPVSSGISGASGGGCGLLEDIDVHPESASWAQHELILLTCQVARAHGRIKRSPGSLEGLAEVIGSRTRS